MLAQTKLKYLRLHSTPWVLKIFIRLSNVHQIWPASKKTRYHIIYFKRSAQNNLLYEINSYEILEREKELVPCQCKHLSDTIVIIVIIVINPPNSELSRFDWTQNKTERIRKEILQEIWKKLLNMKVTVIPIITGALGTVTERLLLGLEDLEIVGPVKNIQTTALLRLSRILGIWGNIHSLRIQWKTISYRCREKPSNESSNDNKKNNNDNDNINNNVPPDTWKMPTAQMREEIYDSLKSRGFFPEKQKGCR